MSLISAKNAALGYEGKVVAEGLSLQVKDGDYLCIVGENGSGKTTLMKAMLGLIPLVEGEISYGEGLKNREIGYLPQQTEVQRDFPASVREIVLSGCLNRCGARPFYNREEKNLAVESMTRLGISELSRRCYRELSGGQQQRVLLARALCATQKLLLLDEPAAGLDPQASKHMYDIIEELNKKDGISVVMISHDIAQAAKYASHILHIASKPLFFGTAEDYLESDIGKAYKGIFGGEV